VDVLLFGDSLTSNVWRVVDYPSDYAYSTLASYRTKPYAFGGYDGLKELDAVYVEGYISQNTSLTIRLMLDEDGYTQTLETTVDGTESAYLFENVGFNTFGETAFGTDRFGSNADASGKKKFRVYLNKNIRRTPFFTAQLEFISDGQNQAWEVIRYGFLVRPHSQPIPTSLMRSW
jgi:hypothetical protein